MTLRVNLVIRSIMDNRDGFQPTMTRRFTDAENTGAPIVPMTEEVAEFATDGAETDDRLFLEEMVWSHRQ